MGWELVKFAFTYSKRKQLLSEPQKVNNNKNKWTSFPICENWSDQNNLATWWVDISSSTTCHLEQNILCPLQFSAPPSHSRQILILGWLLYSYNAGFYIRRWVWQTSLFKLNTYVFSSIRLDLFRYGYGYFFKNIGYWMDVNIRWISNV